MSEHRLTANFADGAPPPRAFSRAFPRIAKMDLRVILALYGLLCGWRLIGPNVNDVGLNPADWTRDRIHLGSAAAEATQLTLILLGFELALRTGRKPRRAAE